MKFAASSRLPASATVLLLTLIVIGWCTAAAVPDAYARRRHLQDISVTTGTAVANGGPLGPGLSSLVAILESVLRKYGVTKTVADLLDLDVVQRPRVAPGDLHQITGLGQPETSRDPRGPLNQVVSDLETAAKSIAGSPLKELPADVVCRIMGLTSQLQSVVGGLQDLPIIDGQGELRTRVAALRSLLNDVQGQLHLQLQARGSVCAEQKP